MKKYYITTDMVSEEIEAENTGDALIESGEFPEWVQTPKNFENYMVSIGGFGEIYENEERIAFVSK